MFFIFLTMPYTRKTCHPWIHILRNSHLADCKQRVTQYVVPFMTYIRTKETKQVVVGQVQGYLISSFVLCDTEVTLPYWLLGYHGLVPIYQKGFREQLFLQI